MPVNPLENLLPEFSLRESNEFSQLDPNAITGAMFQWTPTEMRWDASVSRKTVDRLVSNRLDLALTLWMPHHPSNSPSEGVLIHFGWWKHSATER